MHKEKLWIIAAIALVVVVSSATVVALHYFSNPESSEESTTEVLSPEVQAATNEGNAEKEAAIAALEAGNNTLALEKFKAAREKYLIANQLQYGDQAETLRSNELLDVETQIGILEASIPEEPVPAQTEAEFPRIDPSGQ